MQYWSKLCTLYVRMHIIDYICSPRALGLDLKQKHRKSQHVNVIRNMLDERPENGEKYQVSSYEQQHW